MWGWIQLGIWAGLYVANYLLRPKDQKPKPLTRDNLTLPRTEDGTAIPLVYGRCRVDSPVLVWNSDLKSKQNTIANGVYAFHYGVNMLFVVGIPMTQHADVSHTTVQNYHNPRLYAVWAGDKKLYQRAPLPFKGQSPIPYRRQSVVDPAFFGGLGAGGGLYGTFEWFWGADDQSLFDPASPIGDAITADKEAFGQDTTLVPGYRNQMLVAFTQVSAFAESSPYRSSTMPPDRADEAGLHPTFAFTIGENANVDGFAFEVSSYGGVPATVSARDDRGGFYASDFGGDADPVAVIYDVLTNGWSRIGLDSSLIDEASFLAASTTLRTEKHGYSRVHYDVEDGVSIISAVLQQIDAALYEEPTTGKLVLKLIRADYDPATLVHFTGANIIEIDDYGLGGWKDTINEVRVSYTSRVSEFKAATAVAQSLANAAANSSRRRSRTIEYPGISNATTAAQVAARELNVLSRPLKKISMTVNRDGYALRPGSCFKVTWAEYNLTTTIFRCQRVDVGQLFDNKVHIEAVEDAFASNADPVAPSTYTFLPFPVPYPLVYKGIVEVPRWLARRAKQAGLIGDEIVPRFMPYARPSTNSIRVEMVSRAQPKSSGSGTSVGRNDIGTDPVYGEYATDTPPIEYPITFSVADPIDRHTEPYDTTVGILIEDVRSPTMTESEIEDALTLSSVSDTMIRRDGANLVMLVDDDGNMEIIAFEYADSMGGGQYLLRDVWRGLLDTPARAFHGPTRGYFLAGGAMVGRRGYDVSQSVNYSVRPHATIIAGSGGDDYGTKTVRGRSVLPYPPQDLRIGGATITAGEQGSPAVSGQYKTISSLVEEGVDVYARIRERYQAQISRGDDADETLQDVTSPVSHFPYATLDCSYLTSTVPVDHQGYGVALTDGAVLTHKTGALAGCVYIDGHGTASLAMKSKRTLQTGDTLIGLMGLEEGDVLECWDAPAIELDLRSYRNLSQNPRFSYEGGFTPWWVASGASVASGSTSSVSRRTTDGWAQGSAAAMSLTQTLKIGNYLPRAMSLVVAGYFRAFYSDTDDTRVLTVTALDSSGTSLATASVASAVPPSAAWEYAEIAVTAPANTTSVRLTATGTNVAAGGTASADIGFAESLISVGQIYNGTLSLLTNPSFVTLGSWTVSAGGFVADTVSASPSVGYARGGAFATSTMYQEFTLPAGYERNARAVLRFWRMQDIAGDTGTVTVEIMDAASTVLASSTTGAVELSTLSVWERGLLAVSYQNPANATKVRVTFTAVRTGGAGNSGACIDDVHLSLHKVLESEVVDMELDFTEPSSQYMPQNWAEFLTRYDVEGSAGAFPRPKYIFSAEDVEPQLRTPGEESIIEWSDDVSHDVGVMFGLWSEGRYRLAFETTRQSGGSAPCVEARDGAVDTLAAFTSTDSFTVVTYVRVDEHPWTGVECGIVGRRNLSRGWGMSISPAGTLRVSFEGDVGVEVFDGVTSIVDGAIHMVGFAWNGPGSSVTLYVDGLPDDSSSLGPGEFGHTADTCRLRICRSSSSDDTFPGQIGAVYIWDSELASDYISTMWNYAKLPSTSPYGGTLTYTRDQLVYSDVNRISGTDVPTGFRANDRILVPFATNQVAYSSHAANGNGAAVGRANTNLVPSWDWGGGSWIPDFVAAIAASNILDPTGRRKGATFQVSDTDGIKVIGMTFGATTTATFVFYARCDTAATLTVQLLNASDVVKNAQSVTLSTTWTRHVVQFTGWDASTPTARVRFRNGVAGFLDFHIGSVTWCAQGAEVPLIYQRPGVTIADTTMTWTNSYLGRAFSSDGEMALVAVGLRSTPPDLASFLTVRNTTDNQNRREITCNASGQAVLNHYDGAAANVTSTTTAHTWTSQFTLRGRWSRAQLLDNATTPFAGLITYAGDAMAVPNTATVHGSNYGRTATFSDSATATAQLQINSGALSGANVAVQKVVVRSREPKLD